VTGYDIAVVGAGPAGLAAAATAAAAGRRVAVIDSGIRPGGQYWRHREHHPPAAARFERLAAVDHLAGTTVWFAEPGFTLHTGAGVVTARRLVLATGAHDRVVPFPGWDLPGVVTAGGAQALLKGSGVLIGRRVVVAGTGPFLLPVAAGLAGAGARVLGVFEANHPLRMLRGLPLPAAKLVEAARYAGSLARHRIPFRTGHTVVAAHGVTEVEAVTVARPDGGTRRLACDALAVGHGFVPSLELALALGCATRLAADGNLVLEVDLAQRTTVPDVYAAGEVTGIGGADLAVAEGVLAGAAASDGPPPPGALRRRARAGRFAATVRATYPVPGDWSDHLSDETLVCRCEEVPYRAVRAAVHDLGATDARTVKLLSRTGMGWCQGRMCGYAVACATARLTGRELAAADLETFAHRPFAAPVTLGELGAEPDLIE
jgi:NADPH-dependent 2,4-dienoyl-CoA reductase/sulfur reductase-like enzyme